MTAFPIGLLLSFLFIFGCAQLNTDSNRYHKEGYPKLRHGVVPVDTSATGGAVQLRPIDLQAVERGRAVYRNNCIECHGDRGQGGSGPDLRETVRQVPHFEFYMSLSQYQGTMPGWRHPLTKNDREDVVEYLKSLVD